VPEYIQNEFYGVQVEQKTTESLNTNRQSRWWRFLGILDTSYINKIALSPWDYRRDKYGFSWSIGLKLYDGEAIRTA
jgi:hypothetical protein